MARSIRMGLLLGAAVGLAQLPAFASGSVGGGGGLSLAASAGYTRGKVITFRELVCSDCPIQRQDFNRERARNVKESIDAALAGRSDGSETNNIKALCAGDAQGCAGKLEAVRNFLQRRYRL